MRYERKFPSATLSNRTLEYLVRQHPAGFRRAYPDRQINNVYFDSPGWRTFYDNLAGISDRTKYRLRWYGRRHDLIEAGQFELKRKENLLGTKTIYRLEEHFLPDQIAQIPARIASIAANALFPVLLNTYERSYYESVDGCFRLTIDRNLRCSAFQDRGLITQRFPEHLKVVELKYDQEDDDRLDEFTQYWPLRLHRFSKYVLGMQLVYG